MGDLNWNQETQREQLYEGLSDERKDALVTSRPRSDSLGHLIQICRELDNQIRTRAVEQVQAWPYPVTAQLRAIFSQHPHSSSSESDGHQQRTLWCGAYGLIGHAEDC